MTGGINRIWAWLIVEELVRLGIDTFCLASGFRSAPLAIAAAEHPRVRLISHYDERGTAFFALGYARSAGRAAAWITTSGSAVANGLPAVVEADADHVPMVLLTADRPPELRSTGANQAIDQAAIFDRYVRWMQDLPAPSDRVSPAYVLTTVDQAYARSLGAPPGPVHLNCMYRAPLAQENPCSAAYLDPVQAWLKARRPYTRYVTQRRDLGIGAVSNALARARRVLIVAGRLRRVEDGMAVQSLAEAMRWPVFADISSQIRLGVESAMLMDAYDLCLESKSFVDRHLPEAVLYLGAPAVSGNLLRLLARHRPEPFVVVHDGPDRMDPTHRATHRVNAGVAETCKGIHARLGSSKRFDEAWLRAWQRANRRARQKARDGMGISGLTEPFAARAITRLIPKGHVLVLGNSLPIRDADRFGTSGGASVQVIANRGASGIDGTIATAAGVAIAGAVPVTVLLGDLAFLHDLNSLALTKGLPLTMVVINNDGGGIFHQLPVETSPETFERCFGTPHGLHFAQAAGLFGLRYEKATSAKHFEAVYSTACSSGGATIIEVRTDRRQNFLHRRMLAAQCALAVQEA